MALLAWFIKGVDPFAKEISVSLGHLEDESLEQEQRTVDLVGQVFHGLGDLRVHRVEVVYLEVTRNPASQ